MTRATVLALLLAACAASAAQAASEIRFELLLAGQPAGEQIVRTDDGGDVHVRYHYNDRGRGPELTARYRLDASGVPTEIDIEGVAYMKNAVRERFRRDGTTARWTNDSEDSEAELAQPAFYLGLEAPPEEVVLLAQALLQRPGRDMPLLPAGRARIEALAERTFDGTPLTLYALHGIGFGPELLWLDQEHALYAAVSSWFSVVRGGAAGQVPALLDAQQAVERASNQARSEALTRTLDAPTLIRNVRAFDPASGGIVGDSVLIDAGRIVAVGHDLDRPADATELDGEGRFLMPGLWDMHVHLAGPTDGLLHMAHGVTTVRDLANDNAALARRIDDFVAGRDIGPHVLKAGILDGSGPFAGPTEALVDDAAGVRRWIDRYADEGYVQLKLYSSLKRELVPEAIAHGHRRGLRVSGHVPVGMTAREFVELGADELQHANFLFLNFLAGRDDDTRTPLRFHRVAEQGGQLDLSGPEFDAFVALLRERGVVVDPTLVAFEPMFVNQPGLPSQTYAEVLDRMPVTRQRSIATGGGGLAAHGGAERMRNRAAFDRMVTLIGHLHRSGVPIVAGTDAIAGLSYARELELYVQAGIPPATVLRIATGDAARAMGLEGERGSLAEGHVADLILVDGDPSRIIGDIRRVHTVIRGDRLYRADALARAAGLSD